MAETLYIIDGHSQIYRAYYAPFRDLTSPSGEPTRATYVFSQMLLKFIDDYKPKYLAMAIDGPSEKLERRKIYPQYKATRKPMPEDLLPQVKRIIEIVKTMGISILEVTGYEADDIMATAAQKFASQDFNVMLISRDKDLDQLLTKNVSLLDPMKNEILDPETIEKNKGYTPSQAVEIQTLSGDTTDNIPGIPGVGPKTAAKLINQYGTAEGVVKHAEELTPKMREKVLKNADNIPLARKLVTLDRHVPMELNLEDLKFEGLQSETIYPIFEELGFKKLVERLQNASVTTEKVEAPQKTKKSAPTTTKDFEYSCIDTLEALDCLVEELKKVKRLAVDTETTAIEPMRAELVGISLSWKPCSGVYIPVKGPLGAKTLDIETVRKKLEPILLSESITKIGHHLKYDMIVLKNAGIELGGKMFDTLMAAHVLDSTRTSFKLDVLVEEYLSHHCTPISELIGKGKKQTTMDTVPVELVSSYAAEDADVTLRLADLLEKDMEKENLTDLFENLEMKLMPVLTDMEMAGIKLDLETLRKMETELSAKADDLRVQIISSAGQDFNPDSPKQLAEILFEKLDLPVLKKKKTGPSTDSSVLEQLAILHELPALLLDYRKLTKLLNTYLAGLSQCINPKTNRIHTSFHQAATVTGRLSSSSPNLQNIPIRTEEGRKIRSAFVADDGFVLLSADYSQVELRVLAHLAEEETLMAAFKEGHDIHRIVAAEVFGVSVDEVTADQRARAKTVNFGIVYGQTAVGLSATLRIPRTEAAEFIRKYKNRFPRIEEFLKACGDKARKNGYVETILGRRRRISDITARSAIRRAAAERLAINSVVQGSAADLIKQAMINIAQRIESENHPSRLLLQIHDELLFEIPENQIETERNMIEAEMTGAIKLKVPLKVDIGVGKNWMDAK